jgi:ubiquitin carboxyl-terminal hydrolase 22/27/51
MRPHFESPKLHSLFVESRSGYVFCINCEDFIYDPFLEQLRVRAKFQGAKKRKFDDYAGIEMSPLVTGNSSFVPCKAIGLRGLYNMGNTCFMSVVIQSLLHNPFIKSWYLSEGHKSQECERDACTSCALEEIFSEFWSSEKMEGYGAVPMLLSSWKASDQLAGYQQQDAHEYMQFILNSLHSTYKPGVPEGEGGDSEEQQHGDCECVIHKTFYGKLQSTVTCNECKNKTTALDPFMDLSLDLKMQAKKRKKDNKNGTTNGDKNLQNEIVVTSSKGGDGDAESMRLEECLARFTGEEKLAKEDYRCVKCERQRDAVKQLSVRKCPPVLVVHLKVCSVYTLLPEPMVESSRNANSHPCSGSLTQRTNPPNWKCLSASRWSWIWSHTRRGTKRIRYLQPETAQPTARQIQHR